MDNFCIQKDSEIVKLVKKNVISHTKSRVLIKKQRPPNFIYLLQLFGLVPLYIEFQNTCHSTLDSTSFC